MSVARAELACCEYVNLIRFMEKYPGMYSLDDMRRKLHEEICKEIGLTEEETKKYTDNLDKLNYNGCDLYLALLQEWKNKERGLKLSCNKPHYGHRDKRGAAKP